LISEWLLSEADGLVAVLDDEGLEEMGLDLVVVVAEDGGEVGDLLAVLLLFADELVDVVEELADAVLFPGLPVLPAVEGEQLALEHYLYYVVVRYA
jgi:hypothetical protein